VAHFVGNYQTILLVLQRDKVLSLENVAQDFKGTVTPEMFAR
jgi:hypothetical protein